MSTFTMPLKKVIEFTGGTVTIVNGISKMVGGNIGLDTYPLFNPLYRDTLTGKIIDHYWNREIGVESIDMFQLFMRRRMNEIMPYYNQLYQSETLTFDPLSTMDIRNVITGTSTQHAEATGTAHNDTLNVSGSRAVNSDTPQTMLSGDGDYATNAADVNGTVTANSDATESNNSDANADTNSDAHTTGYQGIPSELLMAYRAAMLNIDMNIINDLEDCFMLVWDNGDSYTRGYIL